MKRADDLIFYYNGEKCSLNCQDDWLDISLANEPLITSVELHEPKRTDASAWYKDYKYGDNNGNDST